jgi:hypothetical protein
MLARSLAVGALVLAGCYSVPTPVCGFACASQDTVCPDGYTCNSTDNRCHLDGYRTTQCPDVPDDLTNDFLAPIVLGFSPQSPASTTPDISVQFDDEVLHVDGSSFYLTEDLTGLRVIADPNSADSTVWHLALQPGVPLTFGESYTLHLTTDITDQSDNHYAGTTYTFTVGDDQSPRINFSSFIEPPPDSTTAGVDTNVTVTMTEVVTTLAGKFRLLDASTNGEVSTILDNTGAIEQATLDPVEQLQAFHSYTVQLDADITDLSGNIAGFQMGWSFTTGQDLVAPQIRETTPKANSVAPVTTTINFFFDEPVVSIAAIVVTNNTTTFTGTLASSEGGRLWTFTPDVAFPPNIVINVALTNASDAALNVTNFAYNFTTST